MLADLSRKVGRFIFGKLLPKGRSYPILRGHLKGSRFILGAASGEGGGGDSVLRLSRA